MATEYIKRQAALNIVCHDDCEDCPDGGCDKYRRIKRLPAADVVPAEDYKHLLKIANKMHLWIFNHTFDEQAAYDECGLTDEDNAMLGYGGQYILSLGEEDEFVQ